MLEAVTNRLVIKDVEAASFKEFLKFVYCGQYPKDMESSPESYLPIAEKYNAQELKDACASEMAKGLNEGNVVDVLIMAHVFRCPDLQREAFHRFMQWKASISDEALEPLKAHPELVVECLKNV